MNYSEIDFKNFPKLNPSKAKEIIPKKTGIYFWFDNKSNDIVYIGVGAGSKGLYNRIVAQHLYPKYIEYRTEKHYNFSAFVAIIQHNINAFEKGCFILFT